MDGIEFGLLGVCVMSEFFWAWVGWGLYKWGCRYGAFVRFKSFIIQSKQRLL
jgi:hypothetical protein